MKKVFFFSGNYFGNHTYIANKFASFKKIKIYDLQDYIIQIAFICFTRNINISTLFVLSLYLKGSKVSLINETLNIDRQNFSDIKRNDLFLKKGLKFLENKKFLKIVFDNLIPIILNSEFEEIIISSPSDININNYFKKYNLVYIKCKSDYCDVHSNILKYYRIAKSHNKNDAISMICEKLSYKKEIQNNYKGLCFLYDFNNAHHSYFNNFCKIISDLSFQNE